jgi:hypothetical protein
VNLRKPLVIICCLVLACWALVPAARADAWNQQTELSFNQPIEIPGSVLPPGTYWFVLFDNGDRSLVQIFSVDWSRLYASLLTIPTLRPEATSTIEVELAERPHQSPEALWKWYYPGHLMGHEFLYSTKVESRLQREPKREVLTAPLTFSPAMSPGA